jgi:integrase
MKAASKAEDFPHNTSIVESPGLRPKQSLTKSNQIGGGPMGEMRKDRRRYLTQDELARLISAAKEGRYGQRDASLILILARHGLRVSEAIDLEWDQIDFTKAHLHVRRLKGGIASAHPIQGDELRALRELRRATEGAFVFESERGGPMTRSNVAKMIEAAGERAGLPYAHPHMLRHTCGHLLADAGHDTRRLQLWLGHAEVKHTAHYSELSAKPFKDFWK